MQGGKNFLKNLILEKKVLKVVDPLKGRLRRALHEWRLIGTPEFIIDIIEFGYKLPFMSIPAPKILKNNRSALVEAFFVEEAIQNLLKLNCIAELFGPPEIVNPLSVSIQKIGKKRLILDLRHINLHLFKNKFKCECIGIAKEVIKTGDYLFTFDLKSGYYHVDIFPDHMKCWLLSLMISCTLDSSICANGVKAERERYWKSGSNRQVGEES